jgi:hypothetical protein
MGYPDDGLADALGVPAGGTKPKSWQMSWKPRSPGAGADRGGDRDVRDHKRVQSAR